MRTPNPSTPEATRPDEVETWELGYGRGITGPTACQWHYMPGWSNDFQIVTLPNSASGDCNTVVAVIPKAQAKWMEYARLIAAAPDMLAALRKIRDNNCECECQHDTDDCCNVVDEFCTYCIAVKAIAKTERGQ